MPPRWRATARDSATRKLVLSMAAAAGARERPAGSIPPPRICFPRGPPAPNHPAPSYNAAAAMRGNSQGFTGAQAYVFSGGGMVETDGAYYDPSPFVPVASGAYNSDCGQYQEVAHWPYQLAQIHNHSQYMAGHPAVM